MMKSKNRRRHRLDNKGYSLIELVIVIGIIVVMTGVATVTVTLINSAKAKEASVVFMSELSDTHTKSKNQLVTLTDDASGVVSKYPEYDFAIKLYKSGSKCYIQKGYYDGSSFNPFPSGNPNDGKGISLSSRIDISYTDDSGNKEYINSTGELIVFDRNGRCVDGDGVYDFYKKNGNLVDSVTIKKNGSFQNK